MKRFNKMRSPCLNCGKDTGCPNKLVCDDCRKGDSRKELFFEKYVEAPDKNAPIFNNPLLRVTEPVKIKSF